MLCRKRTAIHYANYSGPDYIAVEGGPHVLGGASDRKR